MRPVFGIIHIQCANHYIRLPMIGPACVEGMQAHSLHLGTSAALHHMHSPPAGTLNAEQMESLFTPVPFGEPRVSVLEKIAAPRARVGVGHVPQHRPRQAG